MIMLPTREQFKELMNITIAYLPLIQQSMALRYLLLRGNPLQIIIRTHIK